MFLLETIKIKNRQLQNIHWHNQRLNAARQKLFDFSDYWDLEKLITLPTDLTNQTYKCRVVYGQNIEKIEFVPYQPRPIQTLKIVHHPTIDYTFKYENRVELQHLYEQRGDCDDVLIVKNGCITDTYYCNIIFYDGKRWITPDSPLLKGTHRTMLLEKGIILEKRILLENLEQFQAFKLVNAMLNWEDQPVILIENIKN